MKAGLQTKDQVPCFTDLWEAGRAGEKAEDVEAVDPE